MTGRFLYRCIICLTRLVNSFLFCLRLVLRFGSVPVDLVPVGLIPAGFDPVESGLVGSVGPGSAGPADFDLSGKHVVDSDNFSFVTAFSTATFLSIN